MRKDSGEAVRLRICQFVRDNPGAHFRAIQRGLTLSPGQAVHHLRRLVQDSLLAERRVARYTHYFPAGAPQAPRAALAAIRQPVRRAIATQVQEAQGRTMRQLVESTGLATSTLHHHLHVLQETSVLRPEGPRPVRYMITEDGSVALALLAAAPGTAAVQETTPWLPQAAAVATPADGSAEVVPVPMPAGSYDARTIEPKPSEPWPPA
jgi:DNA-binding transcriptional ArsR family regulator